MFHLNNLVHNSIFLINEQYILFITNIQSILYVNIDESQMPSYHV